MTSPSFKLTADKLVNPREAGVGLLVKGVGVGVTETAGLAVGVGVVAGVVGPPPLLGGLVVVVVVAEPAILPVLSQEVELGVTTIVWVEVELITSFDWLDSQIKV